MSGLGLARRWEAVEHWNHLRPLRAAVQHSHERGEELTKDHLMVSFIATLSTVIAVAVVIRIALERVLPIGRQPSPLGS